MRTHLAIFFADRGDVAVLKTHVIKSPNLMGWLYWRFAAINVENRGIGNAWRMPVKLSPISDMPDIGDFIRRSQRSAKIAIAAPGTPGDFRRSRRSAYKIARCVAGLTRNYKYRHAKTLRSNRFKAFYTSLQSKKKKKKNTVQSIYTLLTSPPLVFKSYAKSPTCNTAVFWPDLAS